MTSEFSWWWEKGRTTWKSDSHVPADVHSVTLLYFINMLVSIDCDGTNDDIATFF